jgi:predicted PurR-regulated permease PerM
LTIVIGGNVLVPLLVSFALAFMLEPLADWFQRRGRSRSVAVLLTLGSAVLMGALLLLFLLPAIYHQFMGPSRNCRLLCAPWPLGRNIYWVSPGSG